MWWGLSHDISITYIYIHSFGKVFCLMFMCKITESMFENHRQMLKENITLKEGNTNVQRLIKVAYMVFKVGHHFMRWLESEIKYVTQLCVPMQWYYICKAEPAFPHGGDK